MRRKKLPPDMIHGVSTSVITNGEEFARGGEGSELRLKLPRDLNRP